MIQKIADETGVSIKVIFAASGLLILVVSTWVQISVQIADLSSELKFMNAQLTGLVERSELKMLHQMMELKSWTKEEIHRYQTMETETPN